MKRDLERMAREEFDLLVIGGGVYGAAVAWDAALRGLSVALMEKDDFAGATSSNSLKVVHGGLRYLQDGNLPRMRTMVRERRALLRIAPHLVRPLPFLLPTYGKGLRSRTALRVAMLANEWIGYDRNRALAPDRSLAGSRLASREEFARQLPAIAAEGGVSGAAVWFDAQIANTERLVISFLKSADQRGAALANYLSAARLLVKGQRVIGARGRDQLSGEQLDVLAKVTVNAAGPWVDAVLACLSGAKARPIFRPSLAWNVVTRQVVPGIAVGVPAPPSSGAASLNGKSSSTIFVIPWKTKSLIGTLHSTYEGGPEEIRVPLDLVSRLLERVNHAFPGIDLSPADVSLVHRGLLPTTSFGRRPVDLMREGWMVDHQRTDGFDGLLTIVGVKMTACRDLAQKAVDVVFAKLGRVAPACQTESTPLVGAEVQPQDLPTDEYGRAPDPSGPEAELRRTFGAEYGAVLECLRPGSDPGDQSSLLEAQAAFAARSEMAQRLSDVVLRRTEVGVAGRPSDDLLARLAAILAVELGWDAPRVEQEIAMTRDDYAGRTLSG